MTSITTQDHAHTRDSQLKVWIVCLALAVAVLFGLQMAGIEATATGFMTDPNIAA